MLVSELLGQKGSFVATIDADATITELVQLLARHNVGAVLVSPDGSRLIGIVSERDIVRWLDEPRADLGIARVASMMTTNVITATRDDSLDGLMSIMTERHIRHVPILADENIVGIVSIGDVVKNRMLELESERRTFLGYIQSS